MTRGERVTVPWGASENLTLELPERWNVGGVLEPKRIPPLADPHEAIRAALASPIGLPPLRQIVRRARRVAVLVDDLSRPTPASLLMPHVVAEFEAGGITRENITLVTTLGTHRAMTREDVVQKVGADWTGCLRWENHEYAAPSNVYLGTTSRGTPVYINGTVASADFVVSLGVIEPHVIAGFGGGYKNLIPGAASAQTIAATHTLNLTPSTFNMTGRPAQENPMRLDLEEAGSLLRKPFFIVNTILDAALRIVRVVAGHPIAAHREGVKTAAELFGAKIPRPSDVLIADSYPMDIDLRQGLKALANNIRAVRPGGLVITLIRAREGVGHIDGGHNRLPLGRGMLKLLAPLLLRGLARKRSAAQGEEFKFFTYFALQALRRNDLLIYAPTVPREMAARMPFAEFSWTPEELWRFAGKKFPNQAEVLIAPAGGVTYPIL